MQYQQKWIESRNPKIECPCCTPYIQICIVKPVKYTLIFRINSEEICIETIVNIHNKMTYKIICKSRTDNLSFFVQKSTLGTLFFHMPFSVLSRWFVVFFFILVICLSPLSPRPHTHYVHGLPAGYTVPTATGSRSPAVR